MPAKKAATATAEGATADPPRRSSRISAQPGAAAPAAEKPASKPKASRKRTADVADEGAAEGDASKKKAKSDKPEEKEAEPSTEKLSTIDIGDSLPTLTLKNEKGEDIQIGEIANEKGVVLFLVPKADTPGCTNQACGFRDIYSEFTSVNYDIYCLSADTSAAQTKWQTKKELPYGLISDPKRQLITALGAGEGGKTKRSHFVFEKGGKLVDKKIPVKPVDSPKLALEFIKSQES